VHGAYVFDFLQAANPHAADPLFDLDMASYGIVKPEPFQSGDVSIRWARKQAFQTVADVYRRLKDGNVG
jgi:hypothetical protein